MALPVRVARGQSSDSYDLARNDFNTMLSRLFGENQDAGLPSLSNFGVDIREENDRIIVEADLPGFQKDDIDITLEDGTLTIMAEHREEVAEPSEAGNGNRRQEEQRQGSQQAQPQAQGKTEQNQQQSQRQRRQQQGEYLLRERRIQRVVRSFTLPANVDEENVEARLENGVLKIILQKREDAKPRRVKVA